MPYRKPMTEEQKKRKQYISKLWRLKNKERLREHHKHWYLKNKERLNKLNKTNAVLNNLHIEIETGFFNRIFTGLKLIINHITK